MSESPGNVFIGWSGPHSEKVAVALHDWLPDVIQGIKPWMSKPRIQKGTPWFDSLAAELEDAIVGVFCFTPDNLGSEWMHFEAGMVAKKIRSESRVCPYLLGVKHADLLGPFGLLQATEATKDDTADLLATINQSLGVQGLDKDRLSRAFEKSWDDLEAKLKGVRSSPSFGKIEAIAPRPTGQILEELAGGIQRIESRIAQLQDLQHASARTTGVRPPEQVFGPPLSIGQGARLEEMKAAFSRQTESDSEAIARALRDPD